MPTQLKFGSLRVLQHTLWMPTRGRITFSTSQFVKVVLFCKYSALALFTAGGEHAYGAHFFSAHSKLNQAVR